MHPRLTSRDRCTKSHT